MTTIPSTAAATATGAGTQTAATAPKEAAAIAADFETFLKLLTTQLKNQDPIKPLESTQFVAQLASFSAVEQQAQTNSLLRSAFDTGSMGGGGLAEYASLIGLEGALPGSASFDGRTPVSIRTEPSAAAMGAMLVVRNDFGQKVSEMPVDQSATELVWDGYTAEGVLAPLGEYKLTVEYTATAGDVTIVEAAAYARVAEVRAADDGIQIVSQDGKAVAVDTVRAFRKPA